MSGYYDQDDDDFLKNRARDPIDSSDLINAGGGSGNWGDVYNYDELHGDYLLWYESGGQEGFTTQMCVDYYRMYDDAEEREFQSNYGARL